METKIKTTDLELNEDLKNYLEKRLEAIGKMVDLNNPTLLAEVELARTTEHHQTGDIFKAELNLSIDGQRFRAVAERLDISTAIDEMRDQIIHELRTYKGKKQSLIKRGGAKLKMLLRKFYK